MKRRDTPYRWEDELREERPSDFQTSRYAAFSGTAPAFDRRSPTARGALRYLVLPLLLVLLLLVAAGWHLVSTRAP